MRILIVTMFGFNDAFKFSHQDQTASTLTQLGHKVTCYAYLDEKNSLHRKAIEERAVGLGAYKVRRFKPPKYIISLKLRKVLKEDGPYDVIHLHHLRNKFSYEVTRFSLRENIPLIFEPHGLLHDPYLVKDRDFPFSGPILEDNIILTKTRLFKKIVTHGPLPKYSKNYSQHFVLKKAQVLIALSQHERDLLSRITRRADIEIVSHWVDTRYCNTTPTISNFSIKRPLFLFVGQLKYRRGFDIAIKILARLKKKNPLVTLIVVTNNIDRKRDLLDLAQSEGVAENVILKENVSEEEKFSLYKQADLYLSPTRYEGFGVTFLEAMACGCPVVTSDIPVVREIIEDGRTGLLARLDDPYDFSKKINRLLTDHALQKDIIKNSLQKVELEYNKEKIFDKLLSIYEKFTA